MMNKKIFRSGIAVALLCLSLPFSTTLARAEAITADHSVVAKFDTIPDSGVQQVKNNFGIFYSHTSHVSQIVTGMGMLLEGDSLPDILSTSPTQNELNVVESTNITVTFNVDMDETTINDSTFVVDARSTGRHPGAINYDSLNRTATFDPLSDFKAGEVVTVVLTKMIKSSGGIPLDSSYIWSFNISVKRSVATFAPDSTYPAGDGPRSLFAADLDGDGDLDLATVSGNPGKLSILLNHGDGTFVPDSVYTINWYPFSICAADLDVDGDNDLAIAVEEAEYMGNVTVLLNNGDGTFGLPSLYPVGSAARSIFAADLDGDGDIDLAVGQYFANQRVSILLNNGNGTFVHSSDCPVSGGSYSLYASDLDGDKDLDLASVNGFAGSVSVLLNDGAGNFAFDSAYASGYGPFAVSTADLDADGDNDLAAAGHYSEYFGFVNVFLNSGDGKFILDSTYSTSLATNSIFASDLDGDSDLDLTGTDQLSQAASVLLNNGDGTFTLDSFYSVGSSPLSIYAADLDNDGDLDLATANSLSDNVSVLLNTLSIDPNGDGEMTVADIVFLVNYLFKGGPAPEPFQAGDANCDGKVTISDVVYLISYLFKGGQAPKC